jgi:mRNA-degrading endonuclease toxin of MazEF toxin-antitoxin module
VKKFNKWNEVKINIDAKEKLALFKARDIFWANIGENVGREQDGKGQDFTRPVLVIKKFSKTMFFGVPLSSKSKNGSFFFGFTFQGKLSTALLVQAKMYDVKRLDKKMGMIDKDNFEKLKERLKVLLEL